MRLYFWQFQPHKGGIPKFHHYHKTTPPEFHKDKYHLLELPLRNTIPVEDDSSWFESRGFVELDQQLPDHGSQILDDFLAVLLHPHGGTVTVGMSIHASHNLGKNA